MIILTFFSSAQADSPEEKIAPQKPGWELVFEDNFDNETVLSPEKWIDAYRPGRAEYYALKSGKPSDFNGLKTNYVIEGFSNSESIALFRNGKTFKLRACLRFKRRDGRTIPKRESSELSISLRRSTGCLKSAAGCRKEAAYTARSGSFKKARLNRKFPRTESAGRSATAL